MLPGLRVGARARVGWVGIAALAAVTALILSACGSSGNAGSDGSGDVYKVGFVLELSGDGSVYAETTQAGTKAAVADVNKHDIAGMKFVADTADAGSNAQDTATACSRLSQRDDVDAIVAFVPGPNLLACSRLAERDGIPVLSLSAGAGNICAPNLTSYGLVPNQQTLPVMKTLLGHGKNKWYFFGANYSTPKTTISVAKSYLTSHGGSVAGESYEPIGTANYSQDINRIVRSHPDVAFLNVVGNDDVALQKQWAADPRTKGITRVDILLGEGTAHALGDAARGIWSSNAYFSAIEGSGNASFKKQIEAAGLKQEPDINSYISYIQVEALARAVKKVGTDPSAVIAALKNTDFQGPVGQFQIKNDFSYQPVYLATAGADGAFTIKKKSAPITPKLSCIS